MQLGKAAGYALGFKLKGVTDAVTVGIVGDGTTAEGDLHDTMNAVSVWSLPTIIMVTDNRIAISTKPDSGRGIKSFEDYAKGFGVRFFSCDGRDFWDVYEATYACAKYVRDEQKPAFLHVHDLPRFNGHSSAAETTFDLSQADPIISFGQKLVELGVLTEEDVLKRVEGKGADFFVHHNLGRLMGQEDEQDHDWHGAHGSTKAQEPRRCETKEEHHGEGQGRLCEAVELHPPPASDHDAGHDAECGHRDQPPRRGCVRGRATHEQDERSSTSPEQRGGDQGHQPARGGEVE